VTNIKLMTDRPEAGDSILRALRRLALAILTSPTLELVLVAGIVSVIAHFFWEAIDHDPLFLPVIVGVAIYDALVAAYMVKTMWRRVRE
jgi:hypothetical protein